MLILFAPLLSLIALATGAVASAVALILNGPRRLRGRPERPMVVMPPVPWPDAAAEITQTSIEEAERAAASVRA